jgi:hypothetical protein
MALADTLVVHCMPHIASSSTQEEWMIDWSKHLPTVWVHDWLTTH